MRRHGLTLFIAVALASICLAGAPTRVAAATVWAVGDGAVPEATDEAVAAMIERNGLDRLLYLGDVYETGTAWEFAANYATSFGRFKAATHPTPGNHEWPNRATGYDRYWGRRVRQRDGGHYYSFELAGWHLVSLNSEEPLGRGSKQLAWLRRDLAAHGGDCTIGFWHRPRYSAGGHPDTMDIEPAWSTFAGRAVAVLNGHDHSYQRFHPQRGIVQLVVGTGGRRLYSVNEADPRLAAAFDRDFGALRLALAPGRADFAFFSTTRGVLDAGALTCSRGVSITGPRPGATVSRRARSISGTAPADAGPVRLTVLHRSARGCRVLVRGRFRPASCRSRRSVAARGREPWSLRLPRAQRLSIGVYAVTARAQLADGRLGRAALRFRVRRGCSTR